MGIALDDYLTRSKIFRAALILAQEKDRLTIREISNKLGFYDLSTFDRQFMIHLGTNSWKWRSIAKWKE